MSNTSNHTSKLSKEQEQEIVELCKDESLSYKSIADTYKVSDVKVSKIARDNGIHRSPRAGNKQAVIDLDKQIELKKAELDALLYQKKLREIHFEWQDETTVIVYGVDTKFIEMEGMIKLREFITKGVNHK
jgi:hypothetical protein